MQSETGTCKAPVRSPTPEYQYLAFFYKLDALLPPNQQCQSNTVGAQNKNPNFPNFINFLNYLLLFLISRYFVRILKESADFKNKHFLVKLLMSSADRLEMKCKKSNTSEVTSTVS